MHDWLDKVIDGTVGAELGALVAELDPHGRSDALGQKLLALTVPGVPDLYQGSDLWEDSLVDPDNRRPVDFDAARAALASGTHPKLKVVTAALQSRREHPDTFLAGGYTPALASGAAADHLVAFRRGTDELVAVSRWTVRLAETGWGDTVLPLPGGHWRDRLSGAGYAGRVPAASLFAGLPVALLERTDA